MAFRSAPSARVFRADGADCGNSLPAADRSRYLVRTAAGEDAFTLAIVPDAQLETGDSRLRDRFQWLADNRSALNLKMVLLCGDLMNFNDDAQYAHQRQGVDVLNAAHLPFAAALGNHDTAAARVDGGSAAPGNVNASDMARYSATP